MDNKILLEMEYSISTASCLLQYQLEIFQRKTFIYCNRERPYHFMDLASFLGELKMAEYLTGKEINLLKEFKEKLNQILSQKEVFSKLPPKHDKTESDIISIFYTLERGENLFEAFRLRKFDGSISYDMYPALNGELDKRTIVLGEWNLMDKYEIKQELDIYHGDKPYEEINFIKLFNDCDKLLNGIKPYIENLSIPFNHDYSEKQIEELASFLVKNKFIQKINSNLFRDIMNGKQDGKIDWQSTAVSLKSFIILFCKKVEFKEIGKNKYMEKDIKEKFPYNETNRFFTIKGKPLSKGSFTPIQIFNKIFENLY